MIFASQDIVSVCRRLLFLCFLACCIFLSVVGVWYLGFTTMGKELVHAIKDTPAQWSLSQKSNRELSDRYDNALLLSDVNLYTPYSGSVILPPRGLIDDYKTTNIKVSLPNIDDYSFTGFVVRTTGTGVLHLSLYSYTPGRTRPTFLDALGLWLKSMMGNFFGFDVLSWEYGPYAQLGGLSLPWSIDNSNTNKNIQCIQFFNANHSSLLFSNSILPDCLVQIYNRQEINMLYQLDRFSSLYLLLSFFTSSSGESTKISYSIEPIL